VELTHDDVAEILRLIDSSDLTHLHVRMGDFTLEVSRGGPPPAGDGQPAAPPAATQPAEVEAPPTPASVPQDGTIAAPGEPAAGKTEVVTAPLMGTFYRAAKPGEPPFVKEGSTVDVDTVLCLIEVMKLMQPVHAGVRGVVEAIHVKDSELVEFGQALFTVRTDRA
jgi:acetyl-CoA carboxylase biotin carboxyl carrier protein